MPHVSVGTRRGELLISLRVEKYLPGRGKQDKPAEDENVAQDVQGIKMSIAFPAEQRVPKMACVV